LYSEGMATP